jgi:hypothetical protein
MAADRRASSSCLGIPRHFTTGAPAANSAQRGQPASRFPNVI